MARRRCDHTGCQYVTYLPSDVVMAMEELIGAPPERWHNVLPKASHTKRMAFGQLAMGHPIAHVWLDPSDEDVIVCAEW